MTESSTKIEKRYGHGGSEDDEEEDARTRARSSRWEIPKPTLCRCSVRWRAVEAEWNGCNRQ
jgi:hypothetical protein